MFDTTKIEIFKQITTPALSAFNQIGCVWYHKDRNFQANHNQLMYVLMISQVVFDTTKIEIFKQITTKVLVISVISGCVWYHKDRNFQANHNSVLLLVSLLVVVFDTTKIEIFKQITTRPLIITSIRGCVWYHKDRNFQANHNSSCARLP